MNLFPEKSGIHMDEKLRLQEIEIARLEKELADAEEKINAFENKIRLHLQPQISRLRELTGLYKNQKKAKKAKRLEQKKKGKNYKPPVGIKRVQETFPLEKPKDEEKEKELKRLYKEAIKLVHPDKFAGSGESISEQAHSFTVKLNSLYKSENLEELSQFHEHIISGNAMSYSPRKRETAPDPGAMTEYLKKKKEELITALEKVRNSVIYEVLTFYPEPHDFIGELRLQFSQKIAQFEKRTRNTRGE